MLNDLGLCLYGYKEGDIWLVGIRCGGCSCYVNGWNCVM